MKRRLCLFLALFATFVGGLTAAEPVGGNVLINGTPGAVPHGADSTALSAGGTVKWSESFETDGISWRPLYQERDVRVTGHERSGENIHSGTRSEKVTLDFPNPGFAFLGHYVDYPLLFDEASPSVWICADRPNITLGMLVVLPKTIRPDTGRPLTILLAGSTYYDAGEWERLSFPSKLRQLFEQTVRAIRGEHKIAVDPDGAYIRQLILFTENKRGTLRLWIDDLSFAQHTPRPLVNLQEDERGANFNPLNLLAFRFLVTNSNVVLESSVSRTRDWPEEPFGIGAEKRKAESGVKEELVPWFLQKSKPLYGGNKEIGAAGFTREEEGGINTMAYLNRETPTSEDWAIISGSGTMPVSGTEPLSFPQTVETPFPEVGFRERILTFGGTKPVAIRAIEYQGEKLAFLKSLHFNAVWLKSPPTRELLDEAKEADLWLIAPPPVGDQTVSTEGSALGGPPVAAEQGVLPYFNRSPIGTDYDRVLMWDLGSNLTRSRLEAVQGSAKLIHGLDPHRRPIVCNVSSGVADYTFQEIDLLLLRREPILTSLDMIDYGRWLKSYQNLGTLGFPYWNTIQTQPEERMLAQCRFFGAVEEMPSIISYEQLRQQVRLSMAADMHGLLFSSNTPLDGADHESQYRAAALELINLELVLTDAWFAGGKPEELIDSDDSGISAAILRTERTSLLLPISIEPDTQLVFGQAAANNRSFTVPIRDGYSADLLLPGNLRKIPSSRRAGGVHLDLEEISMNSLVFLAQSDWYTRVMAEKSPKLGNRMATLAIRLAKMRLDTFRQTLGELQRMNDEGKIPKTGRGPLLPIPEQETVLQQTCSAICLAEDYLKQNDPPQAYLQAERALREIRMNERAFRQIATRLDNTHPVLPVSVSFNTLPAYLEVYDKLHTGRLRVGGANRLIGGDMEKTEDWTTGKWTRYETLPAGIATGLSRNPAAARNGNFGLALTVTQSAADAPVEMESPPLTVEVPVPVRTGELLCVEGWIRIPKPLVNGVDGFMIYESQGGPSLALRFVDATDWRPFAFYRYAAYDGEMKLNFSLSGYGEVHLDDVTVRAVQ